MKEITNVEKEAYRNLETIHEKIEFIAFIIGLRDAKEFQKGTNKGYFQSILKDDKALAKIQQYIEEETNA